MRKKKEKYVSKYENDAVLVHSKILKIELQNQEINGKLKTVFYCESKAFPEGRMCVHWGRTNIQVGDEFQAKGRLTPEGIFVVWSLMFRRREQSATA